MLLGPTRKPKKTNDIMAEKQVLAEIQMKYKLVINHSRNYKIRYSLCVLVTPKTPPPPNTYASSIKSQINTSSKQKHTAQ